MKRLGALVARAIVLALLLLTLGGGIANADATSCDRGASGVCAAEPSTSSFPDDPGYPQ